LNILWHKTSLSWASQDGGWRTALSRACSLLSASQSDDGWYLHDI